MKRLLSTLALVALSTLATQTIAGEGPGCLDCHRANADSPVHAILNTPHGKVAGGGEDACASCHGSSTAHRQNPGLSPDLSFGPRWHSPAVERDASCQSCHEKAGQLLWQGSTHQQEGLACDSCHRSHQQSQLQFVKQRDESCLGCHPQVRAELRLPSRHPIAEGKTACTDCHNPHGSGTESDLHQVSLNDNCYSCHQEKRGPFLFEHAPVTEDCSLCHRPHGSVHPRLLTARGPGQCQQCHSAAFHPSLPYGGEGLPGGAPNANLLGKNCMNCHSQVHGSNHPSGARLAR